MILLHLVWGLRSVPQMERTEQGVLGSIVGMVVRSRSCGLEALGSF